MAIVFLEIQQLKIIDDIEYCVCNFHSIYPNVICCKISIILCNLPEQFNSSLKW